jgi:uncharacterized metal-binding protein
MPSGRTHDTIAILLAAPTAAVAWFVTYDVAATVIAAAAELFGGLMFGPDLDIDSKPYRRWGPTRFLWLPYRGLLKHRSRLSHGILFGTLIRVVYFLAVISLVLGIALLVRDIYLHQMPVSPVEAFYGAERVWAVVAGTEPKYLAAAFAGLWWGAAAHTLADVVGSTLKQIWHAL